MKNKIILTFDLEFWHNSEFLKRYLPDKKENHKDFVLESAEPLLSLLKKYNIKATFFVVGKLAEKYPELIKRIHSEGNEIGLHGYSHKILSDLSPLDFEEEVRLSCDILKRITSENPIGFRAPAFSLNNKTKWALKILEKYGFKYDSSIFPVKTPLYGFSGAPGGIYRISFEDISRIDQSSPLIEIPLAVYSFAGIKIPVAGGVYFRLMPFYLYQKMLGEIQKIRIPVLYFHPCELGTDTPVIKKAPWLKKSLKYYGTKNSREKLEKLFQIFEFDSAKNILNLKNES